jgi:hypothetical protein
MSPVTRQSSSAAEWRSSCSGDADAGEDTAAMAAEKRVANG